MNWLPLYVIDAPFNHMEDRLKDAVDLELRTKLRARALNAILAITRISIGDVIDELCEEIE